MKTLFSTIFFICSLTVAWAQSAVEYSKPSSADNRIERWKDARFGMFIHWGPVALKGTEIGWSRGQQVPVEEYDNLYKQFNPVKFNADEWVGVAKAAGMKYIVLTTKHHDGFCLWNTRQTTHNIMNSPFGRDVVKELAEACRRQGIPFGTYYSTCDWHHPDFPLTSPGGKVRRETSDIENYTLYLKRQVAELIVNYGPLFCLWFDVPQEFDKARGERVIDFVRQLQPDVVINNRTGAPGDFGTPEQKVGEFNNNRPWETCMTIGDQWAWKPNERVKSLEQCLHALIRSVGGDGNFLFNVGPKPDGQIEPLQVERLKEMGEWLQKYGYTIYETRGGPVKPTDWGVSTRKGNKIYLHILKWDADKVKITLPPLGDAKITACKLVDGGKIKLTTQKDGKFRIEFASKELKPVNTIIEIELDIDAMSLPPLDAE
ncbi:MAG: alpha-L-fucosidase [Bacteroidales bacterium]|jgi:alpha-L-fucosidase|nr:alpha-L-fucosidase [Bacteroidales bacterium]